MSDPESREKRSKRFSKDERESKRQVNIASCYGSEVKEPGRFKNRSWANCGKPNCIWCMNPRKAFGEEPIQERKLKQDTQE